MAKVILNIAKTYDTGFVSDFEKTKYFQLQKSATARAELYNFAIALGVMENKEPTPPSSIGSLNTFVRTEYISSYEPLYSCLYYDHYIKQNPDSIDEICNRDEVYTLVEKMANTGFSVLKNYVESFDDETLLYKLIGFMDSKYKDIKDEVASLL